MKTVAVVIPYYHDRLSDLERISFTQCLKILHRYPITLLIPDTMEEPKLPAKLDIVRVPDQWLQSISTYNQMMLDIDFYKLFLGYEYILIYQLDAFVFRDELMDFCGLCYDYIGAPWPFGVWYSETERKDKLFVGNGGLSLRNVKASISMLQKSEIRLDLPEDVYWSSRAYKGFNVAPKEIALGFSMELEAEKVFALNRGKLPFGCHAWYKLNFGFWEKYIEKEGYKIPGDIIEDKILLSDNSDKIWMVSNDVISRCIRDLVPEGKMIYIWGAGTIGENWVMSFRFAGFSLRCIDSNEKRWGEYFWDVPIESPDILKDSTEEIVVIIAVKNYESEIRNCLSQMGIDDKLTIYSYKKAQEIMVRYQKERNTVITYL